MVSTADKGERITGFGFGAPPRIARCPHCGVGRPQVALLNDYASRGSRRWATFTTTCCGGVLLAQGSEGNTAHNAPIERLYPTVKTAATEIPDPARTFLKQALETLHAPDAAAVMAGSAVDAMLKDQGYEKGWLHDRIDQAVTDNLLTKGMGEWAHEVRLESNRPRHADKENPRFSETSSAICRIRRSAWTLFVCSVESSQKWYRGRKGTRNGGYSCHTVWRTSSRMTYVGVSDLDGCGNKIE